MPAPPAPSPTPHWPRHGWIGLGLIAVFWTLNWSLDGLRTHWGFFPLWLGYCLTVDALTVYHKGNSLLTRKPLAYVGLFLVSAPAWWLFEILNEPTQFWRYLGREYFTDLEYFLLASLSFSVVIPAVFGTAELMGTFRWLQRLGRGPKLGGTRAQQVVFFVLGWLMLLCVYVFPRYSAAFMWMSLYFIFDPLNVWLGFRNLLQDTGRGDWREVIALWLGCLLTGFFWELWNYYAYPKWVYDVPFVDFWHVFEMPLLGYLGYLPFALELFALYHLVTGILGWKKWQTYFQVLPEQGIYKDYIVR